MAEIKKAYAIPDGMFCVFEEVDEDGDIAYRDCPFLVEIDSSLIKCKLHDEPLFTRFYAETIKHPTCISKAKNLNLTEEEIDAISVFYAARDEKNESAKNNNIEVGQVFGGKDGDIVAIAVHHNSPDHIIALELYRAGAWDVDEISKNSLKDFFSGQIEMKIEHGQIVDVVVDSGLQEEEETK